MHTKNCFLSKQSREQAISSGRINTCTLFLPTESQGFICFLPKILTLDDKLVTAREADLPWGQWSVCKLCNLQYHLPWCFFEFCLVFRIVKLLLP